VLLAFKIGPNLRKELVCVLNFGPSAKKFWRILIVPYTCKGTPI